MHLKSILQIFMLKTIRGAVAEMVIKIEKFRAELFKI